MTEKRNLCMIMAMKRYINPAGTLILILIAVPMMIFIDLVVFEGRTPFLFMDIKKVPQTQVQTVILDNGAEEAGPAVLDTPESVYLPLYGPMPDTGNSNTAPTQTEQTARKTDGDTEKEIIEIPKAQSKKEPVASPAIPAKKQLNWKAEALRSVPGSPGKVVIIIDDMGMGASTKKLRPLAGPLTLAYLPYAHNLPEQTKLAHQAGHELMVHMPMEPSGNNENPGPGALTGGMGEAEMKKALNKALDSFTGYVGINNHMGSGLTSNPQAMVWVMEVLKSRGLLFIDSKTIGSSVGAQAAEAAGLPYAVRDVFLDHNTDINSVRAALRKLESIAHTQGVAIAIGHPKPETIQGLREWLPTLKNKNLTLVPASEAVVHPAAGPATSGVTAAEMADKIYSDETPDDEVLEFDAIEDEDMEDDFEMPAFSMTLPHQGPVLLLE